MNPPMGKSFAFYALVRGARKGIYYSYPVLKASVGHKRNCYWKGFYSFQEAYDFLLEYCDQEEEIFIEREVHWSIEFTLEEEIVDLKQVYSSFPQYKLSLHPEGAEDRYLGQDVQVYRHLILMQGHKRSVQNVKITEIPNVFSDLNRCKVKFSSISADKILNLPRPIFDCQLFEETVSEDDFLSLGEDLDQYEIIDRNLTTTIWAEKGALDLLTPSSQEEFPDCHSERRFFSQKGRYYQWSDDMMTDDDEPYQDLSR
ncbi:hypothetical protein VNO77_07582 [Canavalia gladiata]|uniref:Ribonuclease H1 N-terminal domain-containing protein n=1 Tax=Canavalia gladiata TaxID=3824 RepID=A0AAN9QWP8_CANGL